MSTKRPKRARPLEDIPPRSSSNPTVPHSEIAQTLTALAGRVGVLEALLERYDSIWRRQSATAPLSLPTHVRLEAQEYLEPESGFHTLEYDRDGEAIRWSGPGRVSRLSLFICRAKPIVIRLGVKDFAGIEPAAVRVNVDGESLAPRLVDGSWQAGPFLCPDGVRCTTIEISVPATHWLETEGESSRSVGFAFTHLEVAPA